MAQWIKQLFWGWNRICSLIFRCHLSRWGRTVESKCSPRGSFFRKQQPAYPSVNKLGGKKDWIVHLNRVSFMACKLSLNQGVNQKEPKEQRKVVFFCQQSASTDSGCVCVCVLCVSENCGLWVQSTAGCGRLKGYCFMLCRKHVQSQGRENSPLIKRQGMGVSEK